MDVPLPWPEGSWRNSALRHVGMTTAEFDAAIARQSATFSVERELLQQWWLQRLLRGNPLRERMALFLQSRFGCSSTAVASAEALGMRTQRLRRLSLGSFPALLREFIVDPAAMIQIGMDGHDMDRVSDRPAKLVLDKWTVGPGNYSPQDVEDLSRALTGWRLVAGPGFAPTRAVDAAAPLAARRTGLKPQFDVSRHDAGEKTLLGATGHFDARAAIDVLARHPLTARRFAQDLLAELGILTASGALLQRLQDVYLDTAGSIVAMMRAAVRADEFWEPQQRWSRVKSPVQLAIGACLQLELTAPQLPLLGRWLNATGQSLFDTPDNGESPWPTQEGWLAPPERLALRYQLPEVLAGTYPPTGLEARTPRNASHTLLLPRALATETDVAAWQERLDPAPGLVRELDTLQVRGDRKTQAQSVVRRMIGSAQYQLA
jgi:uncharacterized protein (DUF1800 family)